MSTQANSFHPLDVSNVGAGNSPIVSPVGALSSPVQPAGTPTGEGAANDPREGGVVPPRAAVSRRSVSWADAQPDGKAVVLVAVREFEPRCAHSFVTAKTVAEIRSSETDDSEANDGQRKHVSGCCVVS